MSAIEISDSGLYIVMNLNTGNPGILGIDGALEREFEVEANEP